MAFTSRNGLYQFVRIPFGVKNGPEILQKRIDVIVSSAKSKTTLFCLGDIVVFSGTVQDLMTHVGQALTILDNARLTVKLKKCSFFPEIIDYSRHVIRSGRLEVSDDTAKAIKELQDRITQTEVSSFLGLGNVFLRFVPNVSKIAAPMNRKLRRDRPKTFGPLALREKEALDKLELTVTYPPVLAPRRPGGQ